MSKVYIARYIRKLQKAAGELWEYAAREGKRVQSQGRDLSYEEGARLLEFLGRAGITLLSMQPHEFREFAVV